MADILSLSKLRKQRARMRKDQSASENRIRFGRTRAEKKRDAAERERAGRSADANKRET
jgi:hypothetical protein